jgi:hypothetical protein
VDAKVFAARDNSELANADYDPSRDFFDQWGELQRQTMLPILWDFGGLAENCTYADTVGMGCRNAYLSIAVGMDVENVLYSFYVVKHCTDILDCVGVADGCSALYTSSGVSRSYQVFYSRYIADCSDVWFSTNLTGCRECVACNSLQNQSYCIENVAYPKEEYFERKKNYLDAIRDHDARYRELARTHSDNP